MGKQTIINRLKAHQAELEAMGVKHLALFGSTVRGEEQSGSDVDLAAEFNHSEKRVGLFQFARIHDYLSRLLQQDVDLTTFEGLYPHVRESFDQERVIVF